jgi:LytS/YehU family sensor histidine kinase
VYLAKSKWLKLTAGTVVACILLFVTGYLICSVIFPFVDFIFNQPATASQASLLWTSISVGLLNAPKVIGAAIAIKLMKYWWLKQKEKESLEKEKIKMQLQLLKAQLQPEFLFNSLNNILSFSLAGSSRASEMLLKLSDLLSYMLYECDEPLVSLEKEIEMMKKYMALGIISNNDNLEIQLRVKGDLTGKKIAPFLLFPFIEKSFNQSSNMIEQPWVDIEIKTDGDIFFMKIVKGMVPNISGQPEFYISELTNVQKRLTLLYPGKHELKTSSEQETFAVLLKIQLDSSIPEEEKATYINSIAD